MSSGLVGFVVVSATEQIRGICYIREIRDEAVVGSFVRVRPCAVVRACPEERKRRGIRPRYAVETGEPIITNFSITEPGTDEPQ